MMIDFATAGIIDRIENSGFRVYCYSNGMIAYREGELLIAWGSDGQQVARDLAEKTGVTQPPIQEFGNVAG